MLISLIFILILAFGGFALTYLFADEETFLWRISAGNIIGSVIFGTLCFTLANFAGLSIPIALIAFVISALPLALFSKKDFQKKLKRDWASAKGKLQGSNRARTLGFIYYVFFFILFWFFFERAMFATAEGIFTGGSQNLGDLPFHLGAIFSFTEGNNFPPQNPSYADAKFSYPFIADFLTACVMKFGADIQSVMHLQNVSWAFSLLVILERFVYKFTGNKFAGKIAPALLFFSGGLGFLWFFKHFTEQSRGFFDFLNHLPSEYTITDQFRWGNSLVVLFLTQRSLLLGMPLTILVINKIWEIFSRDNEKLIIDSEKKKEKAESEKKKEKAEPEEKILSTINYQFSIFLVGLLAGTLPLVHLHSLLVLFVLGVSVLILKPEYWREWIAFGVGVALIAVPELAWATIGSATNANAFIGYYFGWDSGEQNFILFWLKNTGLFFPILFLGIYLAFSKTKIEPENKKKKIQHTTLGTQHLQFYLPFLFCFVVSNVMRLAPWQWDNIKVLIYWFIGSLPFAAIGLVWLFNKNNLLKIVAVGSFIILIFSGALSVYQTASRQIKINVFSADDVRIAERIKELTEPRALFANSPSFVNSPVVLSGRRSVMRYVGHLNSYGIDYKEREEDLKRIYEGNATAEILIKKYGIEYIILTPEEKRWTRVNEEYLKKFRLIAQSGENKVYKVGN